MSMFLRFPLPTDDSAYARSALAQAPVVSDGPAPRPTTAARLTARTLSRLARHELAPAARLDPCTATPRIS